MNGSNIRVGMNARDKAGNINYGLPVKVIDENDTEVMVGFIDLDGLYRENWMVRERLEAASKDAQPLAAARLTTQPSSDFC